MTDFDDMMTLGAWPALAAHQVAGVTYTSPSGSATTDLTIAVERMGSELTDNDLAQIQTSRAIVRVLQGDLASPEIDGSFAVDSDTWRVVGGVPQSPEGGIWELECEYTDFRRVQPERG